MGDVSCGNQSSEDAENNGTEKYVGATCSTIVRGAVNTIHILCVRHNNITPAPMPLSTVCMRRIYHNTLIPFVFFIMWLLLGLLSHRSADQTPNAPFAHTNSLSTHSDHNNQKNMKKMATLTQFTNE